MEHFLDRKNTVAVVGVSASHDKWGWKVFKKLIDAGYTVYAVNNKHGLIDNYKCHQSIKSLPTKPDVVITIVPPRVTEIIVKECKRLGINKVWMQPGSESVKAIKFCEDNGIKVIHNACIIIVQKPYK